jgi:hypothetical protein
MHGRSRWPSEGVNPELHIALRKFHSGCEGGERMELYELRVEELEEKEAPAFIGIPGGQAWGPPGG